MLNRNGRDNVQGNRPQGSAKCECPKCGHQMTHRRGIPCNQIKCPKCGAMMTGEFC